MSHSQLTTIQKSWGILHDDMITQLPKQNVFDMVLISVAKAYMDTNTKEISEVDRTYLVNELTDNILKYHPSIRLNEIPEAIGRGVRKQYGEVYGLSVVRFLSFIDSYLLSASRTQLVKERSREAAPKPVPGREEQFEVAKSNVLMAFKRKTDRQDISAIAPAVYDFLDGLQLLEFTPAEKRDMMADATRELIDELKVKQTIARVSERNDIKKHLEAYKKAITEYAAVNNRQQTLVIIRAKKLALDAFFNNLILEEKDLNDLIASQKHIFIGKT
jgi:hypothetical protein